MRAWRSRGRGRCFQPRKVARARHSEGCQACELDNLTSMRRFRRRGFQGCRYGR